MDVRASRVRGAARRSAASSSASAAVTSARAISERPSGGEELLKARLRAEWTHHRQAERFRPPQLACDALQALGADVVHDLQDFVDGQDLASKQFLTAQPGRDGARVLHAQLQAAFDELVGRGQLLVRN